MGAGILPATIYKGKLYFLFGKENQHADTPGYSDFGGGTDSGETFIQTAIREGGEELTGFLGSDLPKMLKRTYNIDWKSDDKHDVNGPYRMHIFPMEYDEALVKYYNNNQRFIQKNLDPAVIKKVKIFEKGEIKWICVDDLHRRRKEFRSYFQNIVDLICEQETKIEQFIRKLIRKTKVVKNKTRKIVF